MSPIRFSKSYKNDYGIIKFSDTFLLKTDKILVPTSKFGRTTCGVHVNNQDVLNLLKDNNIKIYGENLVYLDLNKYDEIEDDIWICIKRFENLKGEVSCKLVYNPSVKC